MTPRHKAALELAAQGIPVIPLNGKVPAVEHGFKSESDNVDQINVWWGSVDYNIGVRPIHMGCVAIDLDHYKPGGVSQALLDLLPPTLSIATPSGGEHRLYLSLEAYGNAATLGVNVDVRSANGYILWPPSVIDGVEYKVIDEREPEMLPERVARNLKPLGEKEDAEPIDDTGVDADLEGAREWCEQLAKLPDYDRFALAAGLVRNFGLTDTTATKLCEVFGLRMHPVSSETSWQTTLRNARKHGTGKLGEGVAFKYPEPGPIPEAWKVAAASDRQSVDQSRFAHRDPEEVANRPPISFWDKHKTLPKGAYVGFAIGESGSHKSGIFLKYALDIIEAGGRVLFIAAEGAYGIETSRLPKAREHRNMEWAPLKERWRTVVDSFNLLDAQDREALFEMYKDFNPDAVFIDVIGKVVPDINEPKFGMAIMNALQQLALRFDAFVLSAHHPPLSDNKRGLGSVFLHALADFEWLVKLDGDKIWLRVSKMKDGAADFDIPFSIDMTQGVPVIIECERKPEMIRPPSKLALDLIAMIDREKRTFDLKKLGVFAISNGIIDDLARPDVHILNHAFDDLERLGYATKTLGKSSKITSYDFRKPHATSLSVIE